MARAETASASIRSDSIKGLAQSIAKPAYRRLLTAEPALRRAVPALIIAFLLTICVGAFVQILDHRRHTVAELIREIDAGADILAERLDRTRTERADLERRLQSELDYMTPAWARSPGQPLRGQSLPGETPVRDRAPALRAPRNPWSPPAAAYRASARKLRAAARPVRSQAQQDQPALMARVSGCRHRAWPRPRCSTRSTSGR